MGPRAIWVLRPGMSLPHRQYNSDTRVSSQQLLATGERHGNLGPDAPGADSSLGSTER